MATVNQYLVKRVTSTDGNLFGYIGTFVLSVIVSTGALSVVTRYYLEKVLKDAEAKQNKQHELYLESKKLERETWEALSKVIFWFNRAIVNNEINGDLKDAYDTFRDVEARRRDYEIKIISEVEIENSRRGVI